MTTRILLADDHRLVLEGFKSLLLQEPDFEIVGEARNGREAVDFIKRIKVDVVIMDVSMPLLNGVDATRLILRHQPNVKVLALSMHPSPKLVGDMFAAGASGYLLKTCILDDLVNAIRTVLGGKTYLSSDIAQSVVEGFVKHAKPAESDLAVLSGRERETLQLVAEGKATKEIASILHLTVKTVETHRHNIMNKLNIRTIAELTKFAVREGLTSVEA